MINLTQEDHNTIMAYKVSLEAERGYNGPCFINTNRLLEIHKTMVVLTSWNAINKAMNGTFKGLSNDYQQTK